MNANQATLNRFEDTREALVAELADAAFPVALQHGLGDDWLEVKLDLWRALDRAVQKLTPSFCGNLATGQRDRVRSAG